MWGILGGATTKNSDDKFPPWISVTAAYYIGGPMGLGPNGPWAPRARGPWAQKRLGGAPLAFTEFKPGPGNSSTDAVL